MTLTATGVTRHHRSAATVATIAMLAILGIGAVGGGIAMVFGVGGEMMLPDEYLADIPIIDSWLVPGLVLLVGFGFASLVALYGIARRPEWAWAKPVERLTGHHWSWVGTIALGVGHVIWITLEFIFIPLSWLMPTFGLVGLALVALPLTKSVREELVLK